MRISHGGPKARLSIIVDVANGTFWTESQIHLAAVKLTNSKDVNDLVQRLRRDGESKGAGKELKKMKKLHVVAYHRGKEVDQYVIERFFYKTARDSKFEKDGKMVSVYDYFAQAFNVRLQYPDLPLVKMTKGKNTLLPMEVLKIEQNQRYQYKMDERQTSNMIKFAVTAPPERWQGIEHGLGMLDWSKDPVLNAFDVKINPNKTVVDARLLVAPKVQFGQGEAKPGTSGRWDLKAKKFLQPNQAPLKSWAVCVIPGRRGGKPDRAAVQTFITSFCNIYQGHGGKIENKQPAMSLASGDDVGAWVTAGKLSSCEYRLGTFANDQQRGTRPAISPTLVRRFSSSSSPTRTRIPTAASSALASVATASSPNACNTPTFRRRSLSISRTYV